MNKFYSKELILGTALWGWSIKKATAFEILDNFVEKGFKKVDVATNYPINGESLLYGQTIEWLKEWVQYNGEDSIEVICKVGSLSNSYSPECNLSKSFLLTSKALIIEKLGDSLFCIMIHWDKRSNINEIQETSNFMIRIFEEGINVGLSGIDNPELYYSAAPVLRDEWYIQIKENIINNQARQKYEKIFPQAKYQAYGINLGGLKFDKKVKSISANLRNIEVNDDIRHKILSKQKESTLLPTPKTIFDFFISSIYQNKRISEIVIAPSNLNQLNSTLKFIKEIYLFNKNLTK